MRFIARVVSARAARRGVQLAAAFCLAAAVLPAQAAVNQFGAGMAASGTTPFDDESGPGFDVSAANDVVRTFDMVTYRVGYSLTPSDDDNLITVTLGTTTVPGNYVGPPNPQIAYFAAVDLPTGDAGCRNIQTSPVDDPPPLGQSGVTADGTKLFCYQGSTGAANMPFTMRVAGTAPNGATIAAPKFTHQSATNPPSAPTVTWNDPSAAEPTHGLPTLTVSAAPRWVIKKTAAGNGSVFVPGSGPNGEDGYVAAFNIGVHAQGSRKGLEALKPDFTIAENFLNPSSNPYGGMPSIQLVNWNISSSGFANIPMGPAPGQEGCGDWKNQLARLSNYFDNTAYHVNDRSPAPPTEAQEPYTVAQGGDCRATAVDQTAKTATLTVTGTDFSLRQYPVRVGYATGGAVLVDVNNLDNKINQWWVASKSVLFWVPPGDLTPDVTEWLNNTATLSGQSVTGQANPKSESSDRAGLHRASGGSLSKVYTQVRGVWTVPADTPASVCDPNHTGDCVVNQAAPGQLLSARFATYNYQYPGDLGPGYICEKIDNARLSFVDMRDVPVVGRHRKDASTGVAWNYLAGATDSVPDPVNFTWELGIDGAGTSGGTWNSFNTVPSEYVDNRPPPSGSTHADAACAEDAGVTWYSSVQQLLDAGRSLSEITRVRGRYTTFPTGVGILGYIPLKVNATYAYGGTDLAPGGTSTTFEQGALTYGAIVPNQAIWTGSKTYNGRASDAMRIVGTEYAQVTKTAQAPHQPNNATVTRGAFVTYNLQVNLTSSTNARTTDVTVWDVLPKHMSYVPGSARFGDAQLADPVCAAPGVTPAAGPFPADSVADGFTACYWTLKDQPVALTGVGNAAGNLPPISFEAVVALDAPGQTALLNSAFADSTHNLSPDPVYGGPDGFKCQTMPVYMRQCRFSNWTLRTVETSGLVLHKQVDQPLVALDTGFEYALDYAAVGPELPGARLLDVLPAHTDGRGSVFSGGLKLAALIAAPVAEAGPPATQADPDITVLYTSNAAANINRDPYHAGHNLLGSGGNSTTTTNWCASLGGANCPASLDEVTAFMVLPRAKADATLPSGVAYRLRVGVRAAGNAPGDIYLNDFIGDSPALDARRPGSNRVQTRVVAPDLIVSKSAAPTTIEHGASTVFTLVVRNNTGDNISKIQDLPGTVIALVDDLPAGLQAQLPINATGWDCAASTAARIQCRYTGALPVEPGEQLGDPILVTATGIRTGTHTNVVGVGIEGQREARTDNNSDTADVVVESVLTTVSGRVYREASEPANQTDDGSEVDPGLPGVTVRLVCASPAYDQTTTTGADGSYEFSGVASGAECNITETQPSGYVNAYNTPGAGGTGSSDASPTGDSTITLVVPASGSPGNNLAERKAGDGTPPTPIPVLGWPALLLLSLLLPLGATRRMRRQG